MQSRKRRSTKREERSATTTIVQQRVYDQIVDKRSVQWSEDSTRDEQIQQEWTSTEKTERWNSIAGSFSVERNVVMETT